MMRSENTKEDSENEPDSIRAYDNEQILDLIKRTQNLENQRKTLSGVILILMGLVFLVLHYQVGGSELRDFCSGFMLALSIVMNIVGLIIAVRGISK